MSLAKKKICIVDDDKGVHEFLSEYIRSISKEVVITHAYNGHEGLVKLDGIKFDLLITDLNMPHMKGGNMLKHVLRLNKNYVPDNILVFSGLIDPNEMEPSKIKNLTYMSKPFDEGDFNEYLRRTIRLKSSYKFDDVVDQKYLVPFVEAVKEVSRLSYNLDIHFCTATNMDRRNEAEYELAATGNFQGDNFHASFILSMDKQTYFSYIKSGKGHDFTILTEKSVEHFNTLFKQIVEFTQRRLYELGEKVNYTVSDVIFGEDVKLVNFFKGKNFILEFEAKGRPFYLEIVLKKSYL
ncbi:two-component system response regulator [Halobacteriovorax sp. HLS]|uniref:response regulator n=1 Tax=Halobacteriovorax sp. HLS TaxID=2234000 RepID=UPI000FD825B1|nr:response regulator [Halobacteriovorax sp. HLS]